MSFLDIRLVSFLFDIHITRYNLKSLLLLNNRTSFR
jgi:hypothetical protein